jgi:cyanate permease
MMIGITSAAVGPLPVAFLREQTGAYFLPILLMALLPVLAIIAISFVRLRPHGEPEPVST